MKFLLTNDDGIDAAGLEALRSAALTLGDPVVVAPAGPQSGVSHAVTWHEGVRIEPRDEKRYAISRQFLRTFSFDPSSPVSFTTSTCQTFHPTSPRPKWSGVHSIQIPCPSIIGTKKKATSITPATTSCAIAPRARTWMFASAGGSR